MGTMLEEYLKRKGKIITNPDYKNKLEMALLCNMIKPGETEDEYVERIMSGFTVEIVEVNLNEEESDEWLYLKQ